MQYAKPPLQPRPLNGSSQEILVDLPVLHDYEEVLRRILDQLDILQWIAVHQQQVGQGVGGIGAAEHLELLRPIRRETGQGVLPFALFRRSHAAVNTARRTGCGRLIGTNIFCG